MWRRVSHGRRAGHILCQFPGPGNYTHKVSCCVDLTLPHSLPHCLSHSLPHSLTPLLIQLVTCGPCHVPCKVTPSVTQRDPHMYHLPLQSLYIPVLFPLWQGSGLQGDYVPQTNCVPRARGPWGIRAPRLPGEVATVGKAWAIWLTTGSQMLFFCLGSWTAGPWRVISKNAAHCWLQFRTSKTKILTEPDAHRCAVKVTVPVSVTVLLVTCSVCIWSSSVLTWVGGHLLCDRVVNKE